jgi:hypothetical protein
MEAVAGADVPVRVHEGNLATGILAGARTADRDMQKKERFSAEPFERCSMDYFTDVGPLTYIKSGAVHTWTYGWGDWGDYMCVAGPCMDRNGSAGAPLWVNRQGKQFRIDHGPFRTEYFVTIQSGGPDMVLYNLQLVSWP